ncbi:TraB/GumN family protein [Aliidiomarina maris]|uniref:TraB/GumN family protein n=1 Tax=Aliidiomarina maris TaxID=531312 RepID=A0A327X1Y6_9GAMM|nr:TraB/GumN family protein [Aliidiomarina maris]MBA3987901.1 TraB/GumN family protein [Idiomarina sp.]RAJ98314.1 hypothetical protein B0I24_10566 [Aliidiomarina maris]RUO24861.1 TraB/GumN family protein [Aliidiomarina maris]
MNMMRIFQGALLSTLLMVSSAHASLLWKISGNDLEQPSYLFGTIHLICGQDFYMDERIEQAFASTDALVMELDMSAAQTMMRLQQLMVSPTGPYLQDHLSEEQLAEVDAYFVDNFGAGVAQLGVLKPMALSSMVMVAGLPCTDIKSYELEFAQMAEAHDMSVMELESVEFQMGIFDDIPVAEQVGWLYEAISNEEQAQSMLREMKQTYLREDLDALMDIMQQDPQFADHMDVLLDQRNQNWIAPIRDMVHEQSVFIAVGAGHLPGEQGVIQLLQQAGYQVEPITRQ